MCYRSILWDLGQVTTPLCDLVSSSVNGDSNIFYRVVVNIKWGNTCKTFNMLAILTVVAVIFALSIIQRQSYYLLWESDNPFLAIRSIHATRWLWQRILPESEPAYRATLGAFVMLGDLHRNIRGPCSPVGSFREAVHYKMEVRWHNGEHTALGWKEWYFLTSPIYLNVSLGRSGFLFAWHIDVPAMYLSLGSQVPRQCPGARARLSE